MSDEYLVNLQTKVLDAIGKISELEKKLAHYINLAKLKDEKIYNLKDEIKSNSKYYSDLISIKDEVILALKKQNDILGNVLKSYSKVISKCNISKKDYYESKNTDNAL